MRFDDLDAWLTRTIWLGYTVIVSMLTTILAIFVSRHFILKSREFVTPIFTRIVEDWSKQPPLARGVKDQEQQPYIPNVGAQLISLVPDYSNTINNPD